MFIRRDPSPLGGWWVNARAYTAILYLNDGWQPEHGGCLRLHVNDDDDDDDDDDDGGDGDGGSGGDGTSDGHHHVDVEPIAGRLVVFDSRDVPHEVLPMRLGDPLRGEKKKEGERGDSGGGGDNPPARYALTLWMLDPEISLE